MDNQFNQNSIENDLHDFQTNKSISANVEKKKSIEIVCTSILFVILFAIMLMLSLVSVDAQGLHITINNIGIKSAMSGIYSLIAVALSYIMRSNARAKFDMLPETIKLQKKFNEYNDIDRIDAEGILQKLLKEDYNKRKDNALAEIRKYIKDYEPKPAFHYDKKYSKDENMIIKYYYKIKPENYTIDDVLNPVQADSYKSSSIYRLPGSRKERDKKWFAKKGISKFLTMFIVVGAAGELVMSFILTSAIMSTLIRIATVTYSCVYAYISEFKECKINDTARMKKSLMILKEISKQMDNCKEVKTDS